MELLKNSSTCEPMVECELYDPYSGPASILSSTLVVSNQIVITLHNIRIGKVTAAARQYTKTSLGPL